LYNRIMAASDHLQGEQLRMFMRPREVMALVTESVDRPVGLSSTVSSTPGWTMEKVWEGKRKDLDDSHAGLEEDVEIHGVQKPITIVPPHKENPEGYTMGQGHHRVVAAEMAEDATGDEQYIPVQYDKDFNYGHYGDIIWPYGAKLT